MKLEISCLRIKDASFNHVLVVGGIGVLPVAFSLIVYVSFRNIGWISYDKQCGTFRC